MEPTLQDMEDYDKPLSQEKFLNIAAFFLVLISIYMGAVLYLEA